MNAGVHRSAFRAATLCLVACAAVVAFTSPAAAQNLYWTGGSGTWNNSAKWSTSPTLSPTGFTPTSTSNVITSTNAWTITVPTGTSSANGLFFRTAGALQGTGAANSFLTLGSGGIDGIGQISGVTLASTLSIRLAASQLWRWGHTGVGAYNLSLNGPVSRAADATTNMTLSLATRSNQTVISGTISDGSAAGNLGVWINGNVAINVAQAYTGDTTVNQGTLSGTAGFLPTASRLVIGSGVLAIAGSGSTTSVQTPASTMIRPGYGTVVLNPGTSGTVQLEMGAISRSAGGGIVSFGTNSATLLGSSRIVTTSNTNTNGILGPWAITAKQLTADVGNQYLRVGAGGVLETLTYSGTSVINDLTDATANYQLSVGGTLTGNRTANTIYINSQAAATITLGANDLVLNGISRRVGSTGGAGYVTISSTGGRVVIGASNELVLAYGDFMMNAPIVDGTAGPGRVVLGSSDYWPHGRGGWGNQHTFSGGLTYANTTASGGFNFGTADGSTTASPIGTGTFTISGDPRYANLTGGGRIGTNNAQIWDVDFTFTSSGTGLHMGTGPVSLGLGAGPSRDVGVTGTVTIGGNISDGTYATYPVTSLTKSGAGLLVLSGSLLYTGSTGVSAGTLLLSGTNPSTMGAMSATGGVLQLARQASLYNADTTKYTAANLTTGSGAVLAVNAGGSGEFTSSDLDILKGLGTELTGFLPGSFLGIDPSNAISGTFTYSGNIANTNGGSNALGIAKIGGGTLVLSGSNSFTGGVSVRGGTLLLTASNQIGTGPMTLLSGSLSTSSDDFLNGTSSPLTFGGGALRVTGTTLTSLNPGRTTTFTAATPVILDVADAANAFTVGQVLNQTTGNLVKLGPGTLVLSNTNTYSGTTVIGSAGGPTGGTLRLSGVGRISGTSGTAAPLIYSGTLDTNGINVTTAAFTLGGGAAATTAGVTTGSGTVTLGGNVTFDATNNAGGATIAGNLNLGNANRTFTVGDSTGASNDLTISAAITSGSLTKAGAGTLLLSGSNSYAGTTTGTGGVLQFANKNALYGGTTASWTKTNITVHSGATLAVNVGDSGDLFTDANVATLLTGIGGTVNNNGLRAGSNIGFDTTNATSGTFTLSTVVANTLGTGSGAVGLAKLGAGTLVVQGANTFTGTTFIGTLGGGNAGILRLASTGSISGIATVFGGTLDFDGNSRTLTALNLGGGGAGSAASVLTGAGTLTLNGNAAFDATNNPNGATISGNVSLNNAARTFTVGDSTAAAADLTIDALISGGSASGGLTKAGAGRLVLSNTANSFAGKTAIQAGTVEFSSIANVNGGASNLGAPTTPGNGTIDLGSTTSAGGLRYTGTGHTTDRVINLAGTTGGATIDAAGSGALVLTGANTATGIGNKTFTLSGTSTAANAIGVIAGTGVSVNKTGSGLWRLTGASSYDGQLQVLDGTIVVAAAVGSSGNNSPFGTGNGTIIGSSATGASGTAVLLADGVDITRSFAVASSGSGGSQVVVLGATGTGVAIFGSSGVSIRLGRQVTLQASGSATARFNALWKDGNGNDDPVVGYTIGSAGNAGLVQLESSLSGSATGVSIVNGTAQLFNNNQGGEQIAPATPVTVGSTLGAATLDLNGLSQSLSRLTFAGNSGSVTTGTAAGGMLRLVSSGSVSVSGTGHVISSLVDLVAPTTFDTGSASTLTVSSVISSTSGAIGLTKTGLGTLWLSAANTYSGATQVNAGTFVVNGSLGSGALSVAAGATLMGSGTIGGAATIAGIHSPGNSPGVETFSSNLTYTGSSSQVIWELWNNTVSNSPLAYDQIVVNGNLDFTGATSLVLDFGGTGVGSVDWTDSFWDSNKTWTLFDVAGTTSNLGNFSLTNSPTSWLDANGLAFASSTRKDNSFSVTQQGSDVLLRYTVVVPEPASLALAAIGIAAAAWAARRRQ